MGFYTSRGRGRMLPLLLFAIWLVLGATAAPCPGSLRSTSAALPESPRAEVSLAASSVPPAEASRIQHPATRTVLSAAVPDRPPAEPPSAALIHHRDRPAKKWYGFVPRCSSRQACPDTASSNCPKAARLPAPPGALTLDDAIEQLLRQNLNLIALRHEIPMAQADVLTASLRANPDLLCRYPACSLRPL